MFEDTKKLIERYLEIVESPKNKKNKEYWDNGDERYLIERWRGRSNRKTNTPFTMAMDISGYSQVLGIDCAKYYTEPEANLHEQLRYAIWEFENIDSNRYFENATFSSFGSVFETAMFGGKVNFLPDQAPWYDEKQAVFADKSNLLKVKPFDFYSTGLCPKAIEFYEYAKKATAGYDIEPMFPITIRSPFSVAVMVRGLTPLLMDFVLDPGFVHDLMATITGYIKEYMQARSNYLGEPIPKCFLFNDEISTPMLSDAQYQEFVLPYEIELSNFCGGVKYWHSCGVSHAFYESVAKIPNLKLMHVGPWSDVAKAADVFGKKDIALEICVSSIRDMHEKTKEQMTEQLQEIKNACDGKVKYSVRCDGIAVLDTQEECMTKMKQWCEAATEVFQPQ